MKAKTKLCSFWPYCMVGDNCPKRLTIEIYNQAIINNKPIERKDYYTNHPECFIKKIKQVK